MHIILMNSVRIVLLPWTLLALAACGGAGGSVSGGGGGSAPSALSYTSPTQATVGTSITSLTPTVTGTVTSYSVSPALPAGLAISTTTGVISGTPTAAAAQATCTITASNSSGSTTFGLVLTVNAAALALNSVSAISVAPMSTLTITGVGIDATTNSIVAVRFIPEDGSSAKTLPGMLISATSVTAAIPMFFDPVTSLSVAKIVDVDVIEYITGTVIVSNKLTGIQVSALPAMPSGTTTGALTLAFLETAYGISTTTEASIASNAALASVEAALHTSNTDLGSMILALNTAIQTPGASATVILSSGAQATLSQTSLAVSDQIIQAYLTSAAAIIANPPAGTAAPPDVMIHRAARMMITVPPPPPPSAIGATNSANLAAVKNFWANLTGASAAVTAAEQKLVLSVTAGLLCGEAIQELGDAYAVAAATSAGFSGIVSLASSEIVEGKAPTGSELFKGGAAAASDSLFKTLGNTDTHGALGIAVDVVQILYLAATTYPPSPAISADVGIAYAAPGGDTAILLVSGPKTMHIAITPGQFDSTTLVVANCPAGSVCGVPAGITASGPLSGSTSFTVSNANGSCTFTVAISGTFSVQATVQPDNSFSGTAVVSGGGAGSVSGSTGSAVCVADSSSATVTTKVSGTLPTVTWSVVFTSPSGHAVNGTFTGTISQSSITGVSSAWN
jgi:hypothetical protein